MNKPSISNSSVNNSTINNFSATKSRTSFVLSICCALVCLLSCGLFLSYGIESAWFSESWLLIVEFRGMKLWGLVVVAVAVSLATLLLQTLTQSNILTPNLLGFDSLFILLQTLMMFVLSTTEIVNIHPLLGFVVTLILLSVSATLLFTPLLWRLDLTRLLLTGIIFAVLFRSISSFLHTLLSPDDYLFLQSVLFARFDLLNNEVLALATGIVVFFVAVIWRCRHSLDIVMLGQQHATNLGINYAVYSFVLLFMTGALTATATALVGPMGFFGLLVCALTNALTPTMKHAVRIPIILFVSISLLVLGQTVFEHVLELKSTLSVALDIIGGVLFFVLLKIQIKGKA